ncbi:MAG: efflux transporter outer membrane subunit, partial [Comamonas sp.]
FFGKHRAELDAALGQARAAQADRAAAATQLAGQVARSYVALARLLAQREVAQRTLVQRQALLDLSQQRTQAGLDSQVELTQAQAGLPDARTQIEMLAEQITLARRTIAVLCAQAPDAQAALSPRLSALKLQTVPQVLGADLLGRRPDVVAARWRVEAAGSSIDAAKADFYPDVNLTAFVGLNALGFDNLFQAGSRQMGVTPALRLPIFDGKRLRAQLRGKQADLDTAIAQYNGVVLDAVKQAGDAIASVQSLQRQQVLQTESLAKAEQAYDFAVQRYQAGLGTQITVLNTETQLINQRRLAVDLLSRQLDTRVALMAALGGGWQDSNLQLIER